MHIQTEDNQWNVPDLSMIILSKNGYPQGKVAQLIFIMYCSYTTIPCRPPIISYYTETWRPSSLSDLTQWVISNMELTHFGSKASIYIFFVINS